MINIPITAKSVMDAKCLASKERLPFLKSPARATRSRESREHPLLPALSITHRWGADLPLCPPGWRTALNPNYDPAQSWTNHQLRDCLLEGHQVDWFHGFAASESCHMYRRVQSLKPPWKKSIGIGECRARSELDCSKAMDAQLCYGHTSTTFPQSAMALFTAGVALPQI